MSALTSQGTELEMVLSSRDKSRANAILQADDRGSVLEGMMWKSRVAFILNHLE